MGKILIAILFLILEIILLWDFINQLAGLNEDLSDNNCKWKKKEIKYFQWFFPKKDQRRSFKKVTPEFTFILIFRFQVAQYIFFLIFLINSIICAILYFVGVQFRIMYYWVAFTLTTILIMCVVLSIAYYIVHKECKKLSNAWSDFK